jgi:hypothetical protein
MVRPILNWQESAVLPAHRDGAAISQGDIQPLTVY